MSRKKALPTTHSQLSHSTNPYSSAHGVYTTTGVSTSSGGIQPGGMPQYVHPPTYTVTVPPPGAPPNATEGDLYESKVLGIFEFIQGQWVQISPPHPVLKGKGQKSQVREEEMLRQNDIADEDAATVRTCLWKQSMILDELSEGLGGADGDSMADAVFFLREAIEALNKIVE